VAGRHLARRCVHDDLPGDDGAAHP
jgi:hypothetical protein